jgi:hypothetical protein
MGTEDQKARGAGPTWKPGLSETQDHPCPHYQTFSALPLSSPIHCMVSSRAPPMPWEPWSRSWVLPRGKGEVREAFSAGSGQRSSQDSQEPGGLVTCQASPRLRMAHVWLTLLSC